MSNDEHVKLDVDRMQKFLRTEDGPTATEYAVMLALIIVVCIAAISALGGRAHDVFKEANAEDKKK